MPTSTMDSQLNRNIRLTVVSGAAAVIASNLTNPFYSLLLTRMGGTDYQIALLSSLPAIVAALILIPGGILVDRFTYKKKIASFLMGANRAFFLCMALVPFMPPALQASTFVLLVGISKLPGSVSEIAWQSFFADFVPEEHRAIAMARRSRVSTLVGMLVTFGAGQILTYLPGSEGARTHFYQIFFLMAFFISCFEIRTNMQIKEPHFSKETEKESEKLAHLPLTKRFKMMLDSFHDTPQGKRFLIFAGCSLVFHFGWQMGWPLFSIYQIRSLHTDESWTAIIAVVSALTMAASYYPWTKFAAKYGNDITLTITGLLMAITPILYSASKTLPVLVFMNLFVGIATAGFTLILTNITLLEAPRFQRTLYIACYNVMINISAAIAPNVGAYFNETWGIHTALLLTAFFRFLGVVAFFCRYRYHVRQEKLTAGAA